MWKYKDVTINEQTFKPYGWVVIMHVAILVGDLFLVGGQSERSGVVDLAYRYKDRLGCSCTCGLARLLEAGPQTD